MWLLSKLEAKFSSWLKLIKVVAITLQLKQFLLIQVRLKQNATTNGSVNMELLQEASNAILKLVQNKHFKDEVKKIRRFTFIGAICFFLLKLCSGTFRQFFAVFCCHSEHCYQPITSKCSTHTTSLWIFMSCMCLH